MNLTSILGPGGYSGNDYLSVTVSTPDTATRGLPVLVFVHGGGLTAGTGSARMYEGTSFTRDGVVLVTLNYRLGAAGWLHVPDAPDNRGLLDVIAALRWVAANIRSFGGDPDEVTVAGQSAGAMIVAALLACPAAAGLFRRAISQSGTGDCAVEPAQAALTTAAVSRLLGVEATAASLAGLSEAQLAELPLKLSPPDLAAHGFLDTSVGSSPYKPVVDGVLLTGQPADTLPPDLTTDLLIGHNSDEANLYTVPEGLDTTVGEAELARAARRKFADPVARLAEYRSRFPDEPAGRMLARITTDAFTAGSRRLAASHLAKSSGSTYSYEFRWPSPAYEGRLGACHCVELPFVFDVVALPELCADHGLLGPSEPAFALARQVHGTWVRFVERGDPGWDHGTRHEFGEV
jgi:para-nitrobenzyl esterase